MPERRKSKDEIADELLGNDSDDPDDRVGDFVPFTEADVSEAHELFKLLHDHDWVTHGEYHLSGGGDVPVALTLSVFLPSSFDAYQDEIAAEE